MPMVSYRSRQQTRELENKKKLPSLMIREDSLRKKLNKC